VVKVSNQSPLDVKPIIGHRASNPEEEVIAKADDSAEFAALAFKVMTEEYTVSIS
jgi:elongation factor G